MLVLGLALFASVIVLIDDNTLPQVHDIRPFWVSVAGCGVALMLWLFSWRWHVIAAALADRDIGSTASFFFYSVTASATSLFLPQTANVMVVRTGMLNSFGGVPIKLAGISVLLDKVCDLLPVALLTPPALALLLLDIPLDMVIAFVMIEVTITALLIKKYAGLYPRVIKLVLRMASRVAKHVPFLKRVEKLSRLEENEEAFRLEPGTIQAASLLTLIGTMAMLLRSWLIARAIGLDISPLALLIGLAMAQASLILTITPGGLGTLEVGWYLGLASANVSDDVIAPFLIAHRFFQSLFVLIIYFISYLLSLIFANRVQRLALTSDELLDEDWIDRESTETNICGRQKTNLREQ